MRGRDDFRQYQADEEGKAEYFIQNSNAIKVVSGEQIAEMDLQAEFSDLSERQQQRLKKNGIEDLFQVQKSAYKLFVNGAELIVK